MPKFINRTGQRFGRLIVLSEYESRRIGTAKKFATYWKCRCDCGNELFIHVGGLVTGNTKSCGCLMRELSGERKANLKHGKTGTPEYLAWLGMKARCYNPDYLNYAYWGGRSIQVCDRWRDSFENFLSDMGEKPSAKHQLDRANNDGNYTPENCRWVTRKRQCRNTRHNRMITFNGETLPLVDWSERTGIKRTTITQRIDAHGWSVEKALTTPVQKRRS